MMRSKVLVGIAGAACALFACVSPAAPQGQAKASLERILTDGALWGKDFPAVLAYFRGWEQVGETAVAVFPDRVVGVTPYDAAKPAKPRAEDLADATKQAAPTPNPALRPMLERYQQTAPPFRVSVIPFPEDGSERLAWTAPGLELLPPGLSLETVQERLGPPDEVTRQVVQSEKDRRPIVLTGYSYAGGAVVFMESDVAPRPGSVDRVVLDVAAVVAALEEGPR